MSNYLQKIQNLSKNTRKHIMWLATGVIMFFVFIFWLFVLLPQGPASEHREESESLSGLKGQLQEGVKDFGEIQKQFSETKEQYNKENTESAEFSSEQLDKESEPKEPEPRLPLD